MLDDQKFFRDVVERINYWHPSEEFEQASGFSDELGNYLERHLSEKSLVDDSVDLEVSRDGSTLEVEEKVFIILEKNFSDIEEASEIIEGKTTEYDYLIFVSCGVEKVDDWRELEKKYIGTRQRNTQLDFIWKSPELYGVERQSETRGEDPLGGLMDQVQKASEEAEKEDD